MTNLYEIAVLVLLALIMPPVGIWEMRKLAHWIREGRTDARIRAYGWTIGIMWIVTLLVMAGWNALQPVGPTPPAVFAGSGWVWGGTIAAGLMAVALVVQLVMVSRSPEQLEQTRANIGQLAMIAPRTGREYRTWTVVSLSAGICEEILYRGVVLTVIAAWTGPWAALVLSSLVFGLGHSYQGPGGILRTGVVGLVLGLLVLLTGSLLPAMLVHTVMDITSGRMLGAAVSLPPAAETTPA